MLHRPEKKDIKHTYSGSVGSSSSCNLKVGESSKNMITNKTTKPTSESQTVWTNRSVKIRKDFDILVPTKIKNILLALNDKYNDVEYSILTKTLWDEDKEAFVMSEEYFIPKQEVSAAHIDYEEDSVEFNTVIHKHPDNCMSFSGTDDEYINANFDFSLLWVNRAFKVGQVKIKVTGYGDSFYYKMPLNIKEESMSPFLPEEAKDKIIRRSTQWYQKRNSKGQYVSNGGYGYGNGYGYGGFGNLDNSWDGDYIIFDDETDKKYNKSKKEEKENDYCFLGVMSDRDDTKDLNKEYKSIMERSSDEQMSRAECVNDYLQQGMEKDEVERIACACGATISNETEEVEEGTNGLSLLDVISQRFIERQQESLGKDEKYED